MNELTAGVVKAGSESRGSDLVELLEMIWLIREFETRVVKLYRDGEMPSMVHISLGQEAVAAGVGGALWLDDYLLTTHRGHGHCLAKGLDPGSMMAELYGRENGTCGGKGGSMHIADPSKGVLGANAIVGASLPLAVGAAFSIKQLGQKRVSVGFFGEGAANQGMWHEALNLAAIWDLPAIFVCENNQFAEFSISSQMTRVPSVAERAKANGVKGVRVDGNDVMAVHEVALQAVADCLAGDGPVLIEAETYRWHGHYEGDPQIYKTDQEEEDWRARDPLVLARRRAMDEAVIDEDGLEAMGGRVEAIIDAAVEMARNGSEPASERAYEDVFAD